MTAVSKQTLYDYFCSGGSAKNSISTVESELEDLIDTFYGTWTDYSDDSTVDGWSSYTTKAIWVIKSGPKVDVSFYIDGTSDDVVATFTLPFTAASGLTAYYSSIAVLDNGSAAADLGYVRIAAEGAIALCAKDGSAVGGFTNTNQKIVTGQIWYISE